MPTTKIGTLLSVSRLASSLEDNSLYSSKSRRSRYCTSPFDDKSLGVSFFFFKATPKPSSLFIFLVIPSYISSDLREIYLAFNKKITNGKCGGNWD